MKNAHRRLLIFSVVLTTFVYAILVFLIGVTLPLLGEKFHLSDPQKGALFLFQNMGILAAVVSLGPIMDSFGRKPVLFAGSLLIAVMVILVGVAPSYPLLLLFLFFLGVGGGCINVGGNTLTADLFPNQSGSAFNWIGASFGLGAVFIPLLGSLMIGPYGLFSFVLVLGAIAALPLLIYSVVPFPRPRHAEKIVVQELGKILSDPFILFAGLVLFFYVGVEVSTAGWLKDFMIDKFSLSDKASGFVLSGFSLMMMTGRLSAGFILKNGKETRLLITCSLLSLAGLALLILTKDLTVTIAGAIVVGLAYAPVYPTMMGTVGDRLNRYVATSLGVVISIGFVGAMLLPFFIGVLGGNMAVIMLAVIAMLISQIGVIRSLAKR